MKAVIRATQAQPCQMQYQFEHAIDLDILQGEQIAIVGNNGSGKSILAGMLTGRIPPRGGSLAYDFSPSPFTLISDNIKHITFRDSYGSYTDSTYYHQQRWNQIDIDESNTPTVRELLDKAFDTAEHSTAKCFGYKEEDKAAITAERRVLREKLFSLFHLDSLLDKYIIMLSSGELRKFQLTRTLLSSPRILVLENPFIGLDAATRQQLQDLLQALIKEIGLQVILVLSKSDDIPPFITHVVTMDHRRLMGKDTYSTYQTHIPSIPAHVLTAEKRQAILSLPYTDAPLDSETTGSDTVVDFHDVNIRYGDRTILKDLSFTVKKGERWALSGENGAGKSTLLSIVCADNPQAYANDITLFGHRRGSGESIWDIKRHIGYVSPEMHRAYQKDVPCVEIVASGLPNALGLYKKPKAEELPICEFWMDIFGIRRFRDTSFLKLSSGEQRLVILSRVFVKDPSLLILDEPLHGLDLMNRRLVKDIIETYCLRRDKTMIMVTHYESELPDNITHRIHLKRRS